MKILLAEDNHASRLMLKKFLADQGHDVIEAENGTLAWEMYQTHLPRMVLTDWMMPEKTGIELCSLIRGFERQDYCYVIFQTSRTEIEDLVEVFRAGADDYILKPVRREELASRINSGERIINLEQGHKKMKEMLVARNKELDTAFSDLKAKQSQLIQSEKMASIGQLAAGIAHEINNPIGFVSSNIYALSDYMNDIQAVLSGYKDLIGALQEKGGENLDKAVSESMDSVLQKEKDLDLDYIKEDIADLLEDCKKGTQRVADIVRDLKYFARPEDRRKTRIDINKGLQSTLNVIWNELKYKAKVETEYGRLDFVGGYAQKINMVFMHILLNAAQAMEEQGNIRIRTRQDEDRAVIEISDTGCGIEPENIHRIFDPFFTTKPLGQGTGLGMNIAYNIIKEHSGSIDVQSEPGRGTSFIITLPTGGEI